MTRGAQPTDIPRYFLYGDQLDDVELDFLHVEPIHERSGANDWTIRPHAHPDHIQILLVLSEGGSIRIEDRSYEIPTGSLVVVPAAMVHAIAFRPGTDGIVVTAATAYANAVAQNDKRFLQALAEPAVFPLANHGVNRAALVDTFEWLLKEYIWSAPGRRAAIMAQFLRVMVALLRLRSETEAPAPARTDRDYEILSRYRELIENHFRNERGLDFYAGAIGVSAQRLNQACKNRAGRTASELLHERVVIEAKRFLIYMEMTVAEVGYKLGFEDPAYFSRFFTQRVGCAPGLYRKQHQSTRVGDLAAG
jgi:AraC-type DNA-binding domain-containing proteins